MKLLVLFVVVAVVIVQQTRACASSCTGASTIIKRVVNKTVERVEVSDVNEAQWRGACHSVCITVSNVFHEYSTIHVASYMYCMHPLREPVG